MASSTSVKCVGRMNISGGRPSSDGSTPKVSRVCTSPRTITGTSSWTPFCTETWARLLKPSDQRLILPGVDTVQDFTSWQASARGVSRKYWMLWWAG